MRTQPLLLVCSLQTYREPSPSRQQHKQSSALASAPKDHKKLFKIRAPLGSKFRTIQIKQKQEIKELFRTRATHHRSVSVNSNYAPLNDNRLSFFDPKQGYEPSPERISLNRRALSIRRSPIPASIHETLWEPCHITTAVFSDRTRTATLAPRIKMNTKKYLVGSQRDSARKSILTRNIRNDFLEPWGSEEIQFQQTAY